MAVSHAPTPQRKLTHKRKPDPARMYESYLYACSTVGRRRAAAQVAEQYGCSDDTVRRLVARMERPDDTPAELAYTPPDPEYDTRRAVLNAPFMTGAFAPAAVASVESEPQTEPQPNEGLERLLMSTVGDAAAAFEREVRHVGVDLTEPTPQTALPQRRTDELAESPQTGPEMPHRFAPSISIRDDYARQRSAPARAGVTMPHLDWGQLVAYAGPVLILAFLLYQIVLSTAR